MKRGIGLIEALVAAAVLVAMALPLIDMLMENGRATAQLSRRIVLELRAERHQAEAAATTYDALVTAPALPPALDDPRGAEAYAECVQRVEESTRVSEVAPGLALVDTRLAWTGVERNAPRRELFARRLQADPTRALRLAWPLAVVPR